MQLSLRGQAKVCLPGLRCHEGETSRRPGRGNCRLACLRRPGLVRHHARALERPENRLYQWNFVKDLKRRMRRKDRLRPGVYDLAKLDAVTTVRGFDEAFTAPHFGFRNAEDYYYRASAMRVVDRIRVPALIITSADDPFVPSQPFSDPKVTGNPQIDLRVCRHGGHCGFVGARSADDDGYWAENQIVDFVARLAASDPSKRL